MGRSVGRTVAAVSGVALVTAFVWSQRPHPPEAAASSGAPAVPVRVAEAEERTLPLEAEVVGSLRPTREAAIASRLLAAVREVRVSPGDRVEAGELLAVLDGDELEARLAEAEAHLVVATQAFEEAERELGRTETLFERRARSQQDVDSARTRRAAAAGSRDAATEALAAARTSLGHARLSAPFDAVVSERMVDPGDLARPGEPLLRIYDPRELRAELSLGEQLLGHVAIGDRLPVTIDALAPFSDEAPPILATVDEIVPAVELPTRSGCVKLALPEVDGALPGMFARARIPIGQSRAVVVPRSALVVRGQLELVYAISEDGRRAEMCVVRTGRRLEGGEIVVLAGLDASTRVVVEGASELRDGARIRIEEERESDGD